ncbi:ribosomal protein L1 [Atractiella rhizophila]|nr:ribosomal protein L1 [Atractiella rhizophila]
MAPALDPLLYVRKPVAPAPSPPPLPPISSLPASIPSQSSKAIEALVKHVQKHNKEKEKEDMLQTGEDQWVWLVVGVKNMLKKERHLPYEIPLKHPVMKPPKTHAVCLIVKDPQREYKDLLREKEIGFIGRVVGISKLKGKFKAFEARRELMKEYDRFLVDDRVVEMMPKLLGKNWMESNKRPIPVRITNPSTLKATLERSIASTYLSLSRGTCHTIRLGSISLHNPAQLTENLLSVLPHLTVRIPGGWDNVQALQIKTDKSTSLPVWNCEIGGSGGRFWDWQEGGEKKRKRIEEVEAEGGELVDEVEEWLKEHPEERVVKEKGEPPKKKRKSVDLAATGAVVEKLETNKGNVGEKRKEKEAGEVVRKKRKSLDAGMDEEKEGKAVKAPKAEVKKKLKRKSTAP